LKHTIKVFSDKWNTVLDTTKNNEQIDTINISSTPNTALKIYVSGNDQFSTKMEQGGQKPEMVNNKKFFSVHNGSCQVVNIENQLIGNVIITPPIDPNNGGGGIIVPSNGDQPITPTPSTSSSGFYLDTFYNTDEKIQTKNNGQEWFLEEFIKFFEDGKFDYDGKKWYSSKNYGRVRISGAKGLSFDKNSKTLKGSPNTSDHPFSFRINVATTTSTEKGVAWDDQKQLQFVKKASKNDKDEDKFSWEEFHARGYMVDDKDFKNFEGTIYWRVLGDKWEDYGCKDDDGNAKPDQMTIYGRGGLHQNAPFPETCLAVCYKGSVDYKRVGLGYFEKEYHHRQGSEGYADRLLQDQSQKLLPKELINKWIGAKLIIYDTTETTGDKIGGNDIYKVRGEIWVDLNADKVVEDLKQKPNWQLLNVMVDDGHGDPDVWGPKKGGDEMKEKCHATTETQVFSWGGPNISFRIDCADVEIKYANVREIIPPTTKISLPNWANKSK